MRRLEEKEERDEEKKKKKESTRIIKIQTVKKRDLNTSLQEIKCIIKEYYS